MHLIRNRSMLPRYSSRRVPTSIYKTTKDGHLCTVRLSITRLMLPRCSSRKVLVSIFAITVERLHCIMRLRLDKFPLLKFYLNMEPRDRLQTTQEKLRLMLYASMLIHRVKKQFTIFMISSSFRSLMFRFLLFFQTAKGFHFLQKTNVC